MFSACSLQRIINKVSVKKNRVKFGDGSLPGYELGRTGNELILQLQNNGKKGIRL
jgi:hypothetical protein